MANRWTRTSADVHGDMYLWRKGSLRTQNGKDRLLPYRRLIAAAIALGLIVVGGTLFSMQVKPNKPEQLFHLVFSGVQSSEVILHLDHTAPERLENIQVWVGEKRRAALRQKFQWHPAPNSTGHRPVPIEADQPLSLRSRESAEFALYPTDANQPVTIIYTLHGQMKVEKQVGFSR
jgi:hypothetical protein